MSAYEEFRREKLEIDELVGQGFQIVGIREGLDGTQVKLLRQGSTEAELAVLLLLNPDTRKYITSLIYEQQLRESEVS